MEYHSLVSQGEMILDEVQIALNQKDFSVAEALLVEAKSLFNLAKKDIEEENEFCIERYYVQERLENIDRQIQFCQDNQEIYENNL